MLERAVAHDRSPTPNPLIIRPITMTANPVVNVCTAPPSVKMIAPMKSVPLRPMISPTRPAATLVTVRSGNEDRQRGGMDKRTKCSDFEYRHHTADFYRPGRLEEALEVRARDDPRHDSAVLQHPAVFRTVPTRTYPWSYPNCESSIIGDR